MRERQKITAATPADTFAAGEKFAAGLRPGDRVLLSGGLGAGKTLFTKGVLYGLHFDVDEVTSPSFTLINHYETESLDVYHIDLWRLDRAPDIGLIVGLDELEDGEKVMIIEWPERLGDYRFHRKPIRVLIEGDGDEPRTITVE